MELPINDKELATIVGALRLGGDTSLYQKLKIIKETREENPGGAYKNLNNLICYMNDDNWYLLSPPNLPILHVSWVRKQLSILEMY